MIKLFLGVIICTSIYFMSSFTISKEIVEISASTKDSLQKDRDKYISIINLAIKGRENVAVDSVFSNLKVLGDFPAENLVFAMEAWSKALGVSCGHCHNTNDFADDVLEAKDISRQMVEMGNAISTKLKTIKGLSARPIVNCYTCHRGSLKPAYRGPSK